MYQRMTSDVSLAEAYRIHMFARAGYGYLPELHLFVRLTARGRGKNRSFVVEVSPEDSEPLRRYRGASPPVRWWKAELYQAGYRGALIDVINEHSFDYQAKHRRIITNGRRKKDKNDARKK